MSVADILLLMLTAFGTVGDRHDLSRVPLRYGAHMVVFSQYHQTDPFENLSLLIAENYGAAFDPKTVGRYGLGGEAGLCQLQAIWAKEMTRRCSSAEQLEKLNKLFGRQKYIKKPRHTLRDGEPLPACLTVPEDQWVSYASKLEGARSLFEANVNLEAGVLAWDRLRWEMSHRPGMAWDWRSKFRCSPGYQFSRNCKRSVRRVVQWEERLRAQFFIYQASASKMWQWQGAFMMQPGAALVWSVSWATTLDSRPGKQIWPRLLAERNRRLEKLRENLVVATPNAKR